MSNYLNHLVAKNLNVTDVVQPRLAYRYEPLSDYIGSIAQPDLNGEPEEVTAPLEEKRSLIQISTVPPTEPPSESLPLSDLSPPQPSPTSHVPQPAAVNSEPPPRESERGRVPPRIEPIPPTTPNPEAGEQDSPSRIQPQDSPVRSPSVSVGEQSPELPLSDHSGSPVEAETILDHADPSSKVPPQKTSLILQRVVNRATSSLPPSPPIAQPLSPPTHQTLPQANQLQSVSPSFMPTPPPSISEATASPASLPTQRPETGGGLEQEKQERTVNRQPPRQIPTQIVPRFGEMAGDNRETIAPRIERQAIPQQPSNRQEAKPPTIQVHIGRIEVRATPPPVPKTPKSRPTPPVMNLEDYLRQRTQGGHK
ncbi:MAG: hypothetical protein RLP02_24345 [Coleofasciculus sp. C2-GNP5-27]